MIAQGMSCYQADFNFHDCTNQWKKILHQFLCYVLKISSLKNPTVSRVSIVTWNAGVGCLQISHEVLPAGLELNEFWIKYPDGAGAASRTLGVGIGQYIGIATDEVACWQATSDPHASVARRLHHDDAPVRTGCVERFQVTDLPGFCCMWRKVQNDLAWVLQKWIWNMQKCEKS